MGGKPKELETGAESSPDGTFPAGAVWLPTSSDRRPLSSLSKLSCEDCCLVWTVYRSWFMHWEKKAINGARAGFKLLMISGAGGWDIDATGDVSRVGFRLLAVSGAAG